MSTVWQYGDSEVGGWVYDQSLTVTCPANTCRYLQYLQYLQYLHLQYLQRAQVRVPCGVRGGGGGQGRGAVRVQGGVQGGPLHSVLPCRQTEQVTSRAVNKPSRSFTLPKKAPIRVFIQF